MSFAGHVYDMIRRDKEYREQRKSLRAGNRTTQDGILGSYQDVNEITVEELDVINKGIREKKVNDDYLMTRNMIIILAVGLVVVFVVLGIMRLKGWL